MYLGYVDLKVSQQFKCKDVVLLVDSTSGLLSQHWKKLKTAGT